MFLKIKKKNRKGNLKGQKTKLEDLHNQISRFIVRP